MTTATMTKPRTLKDVIPMSNVYAKNAILVVGFALFTALMAQLSFKLDFTPVPITGQTLAVLLSGAALGTTLGAASQAAYIVMGFVLPFYADGKHGWAQFTGSTFGYFVGFVVAAALVGYMAEKRNDRNVISAFLAFLAGSAVIYVFGAAWLAHFLHIPVANGTTNAIGLGVAPFLIGDLVKAMIAGGLLPGAWALVQSMTKSKSSM
jgi:biotin transport system substrate-specific component